MKTFEEFSSLIKELCEHVDSANWGGEENTKHILINPLIDALGYNCWSPKHVLYEYTADVGVKKGEKVDYALLQNEKPYMLIEAKAFDIQLNSKGIDQLFRYYNAVGARVGILTNGVMWCIFLDTQTANVMDCNPSYCFDIREFSKMDYSVLQYLKYDGPDVNGLKRYLAQRNTEYKLIDAFYTLFKQSNREFDKLICMQAGVEYNEKTNNLIQLLKQKWLKSADDSCLDTVNKSEEKGVTVSDIIGSLTTSTYDDTSVTTECLCFTPTTQASSPVDVYTDILYCEDPTYKAIKAIRIGQTCYSCKQWAYLIPTIVWHMLNNSEDFARGIAKLTSQCFSLGFITTDAADIKLPNKATKWVKTGTFYINVFGSAGQILRRAQQLVECVRESELTEVEIQVKDSFRKRRKSYGHREDNSGLHSTSIV